LADYDEITCEIDEAAAGITINRPERHNAFRGQTVEELIKAFAPPGPTTGCRRSS
jgi:naphthoate synthase